MAEIMGEGVLPILAELDDKRAREQTGQFAKELKTLGQQLSKDLTYIFQTGANAGVTRLRREMDAAAYAAGGGFVRQFSAAMGALPRALGSAIALSVTGSTAATIRSAAKALSQNVATGLRAGVPSWRKVFTDGFRTSAGDGVLAAVESAKSESKKLGQTFRDLGGLAAQALGMSLGKAVKGIWPQLSGIVSGFKTRFVGGIAASAERAGLALISKMSASLDVLLPRFASGALKMGQAIHSGITRAVENASKTLAWFKLQFSLVGEGARTLGDVLHRAFSAGFTYASSVASSALGRIKAQMVTLATGTRNVAESVRAALVSGFQKAAVGAAVHMQVAVNAIRNTFPGLGAAARSAGDAIKSAILGAGTGAVSAFRSAMSRLGTAFQPLSTAAASAFSKVKAQAATFGASLNSAISAAAGKAAQAVQSKIGQGIVAGLKLAGVGAGAATAGMAAVGVGITGAIIAGFGKGLGALKNAFVNGIKAAGTAMKAAGVGIIKIGADIAKGTAKAMGDGLKLAGNVAATAIAGVAGAAAKKGWGRLIAIDNAEASLRGFTATSKHVPKIMDAARNSVLGTAFGLDQAATAAKLFATAGVPVSDMEKRLKSLSATAAAAEGDFKGMSDIFSKVAAGTSAMGTQGRLTSIELQQMRARGVNALAALAEHYGITQGEARKMVSEGKVDFANFSDAMEKTMGRQAIEQATTFQGLMQNVGAALGRFGQETERPMFNSLKAVLPGVISLIDQFTKAITPVAEAIGKVMEPAAKRLSETLSNIKFDGITTGLDKLTGAFGVLAPVLGGATAAFAGPLLAKIPILGGLFSGMTGPVGILAGALVALFAIKPDTLTKGVELIMSKLPDMLGNLVNMVGEVVPQMANQFATNAPVLIGGLTSLITALVPAISGAIPILVPAAIQMVEALANGLMQNVPLLLTAAVDLISGLVDGIAQLAPTLIPMAVELVVTLVQGLLSALPTLITAAVELISALATGIMEALPILIEALPVLIDGLVNGFVTLLPILIPIGVDMLLMIIDGLLTAIPQIVDAVTQIIPPVVGALIAAFPQLVGAALQIFLGLVTGIGRALPSILSAVFRLLGQILAQIPPMGPRLLAAGLRIFQEIGKAAGNAWGFVKGKIGELKDKILGFFKGAGTWLKDSGRKMIDGLADGIKNAFGAAKKAVSDGLGRLRNLLPFSPAKEGPFSGRGWVTYSGAALGNAFMSSVVDSLDKGAKPLERQLGTLSSTFNALDAASGFEVGKGFASALAAGLLAAKSDVERAGDSLAATMRSSLTSSKPTVDVSAGWGAMPLTAASGEGATSRTGGNSVRLERSDLDYLAAQIARILAPMAKTTATVDDLVTHGANRRRRGSV